jgi:hypothetical protein
MINHQHCYNRKCLLLITVDHDVAFSFPKDDFNDDYYDLDSAAAKKYIDEKLPLVKKI